jgi:hypothetical protein
MPDFLEAEISEGHKAAEAVASHMERMKAAETSWLIPTEHGMWKVSVELVVFDGYTGEEVGS